ncbi:hypothetical protein B6U99_06570 [Candidatus Geothermarchaeota archaeon ex4572_27]|nr:MAG: hypothetical protein B6U99_06570 [Candidatus Geothermarchaeota archaeon ex4572_27]
MLPASLFMLIWLGILVFIAGGWPLAPPLGSWRPGVSRAVPGVGMTAIWWALTVATVLVAQLFMAWPEFLPYGVVGFWLTLLWGVNLASWPLAGKVRPSIALVVGAIVIYGATSAIYYGLVKPSIVPPDYMVGLLLWHVAWLLVFSPAFITQGSPFRRLKQPGLGVAELVLSFILAYVSWDVFTLRMGLATPQFSFGVAASGVIMWSLAYSWAFSFAGVAKYRQPKRGVLAFMVMVAIVAAWTAIMWAPLQWPEPKLPIELAATYFNLCVVMPALVAHNAFWLRAPLAPPTPLGAPPPDQGV